MSNRFGFSNKMLGNSDESDPLTKYVGPNEPGDWRKASIGDGEEEWVPTPQRMLRALEVAKNANYAIEKLRIPVKMGEYSQPIMSQFQVQQMYPAIRDIYAEHIHSIKDYEGWLNLRERHDLMTKKDAEMLISNRKRVKVEDAVSTSGIRIISLDQPVPENANIIRFEAPPTIELTEYHVSPKPSDIEIIDLTESPLKSNPAREVIEGNPGPPPGVVHLKTEYVHAKHGVVFVKPRHNFAVYMRFWDGRHNINRWTLRVRSFSVKDLSTFTFKFLATPVAKALVFRTSH